MYLSSQNTVDCYKSFCSVSKFLISNTTFFSIMKYWLHCTFSFYYLYNTNSQLEHYQIYGYGSKLHLKIYIYIYIYIYRERERERERDWVTFQPSTSRPLTLFSNSRPADSSSSTDSPPFRSSNF